MIKYGYTIIYVEDVEKTIAFYEAAFGFERKFLTPEKDYGELISGETTLAFASLELGDSNFEKGFTPQRTDTSPIGIELAFVTETIEEDFQKAIKAGATEYEMIKSKPWGQKVGYLRDINGVLLELCTPMSID